MNHHAYKTYGIEMRTFMQSRPTDASHDAFYALPHRRQVYTYLVHNVVVNAEQDEAKWKEESRNEVDLLRLLAVFRTILLF